MLDQVLEVFEINPDYDLNIMKGGQDLYDVTLKGSLDFPNLEEFKTEKIRDQYLELLKKSRIVV